MPPEAGPVERHGRAKTAAAWLVALVAVLAVWRTRVETTHAIPNWNQENPRGLLKSDPALLFWFTQRIAENGGHLPDDLGHTTDVLWPEPVDARMEFPQAQMWLAANTWLWFGGETPLHEWCLTLFSLLAAATGLGVFGLARELTRSRVLGLIALGTWCLLPASWRTTSYVLLGEDLSFPAFVAHLWLLARAARVRTPMAFLLSGLALLLAMVSWHAAGFFVAMEAGAFLAWTLRSGENPLAPRHAWLTLLPLALGCLFEPMLRGKLQILSLPMQIALALAALAWWERRRASRQQIPLGLPGRIGLTLPILAGTSALALGISSWMGGGQGDYSHVFGLIRAKLLHLGQLPSDPLELPFEVRILWQGPFDTMPAGALAFSLNTSLIGLALLAGLAVPSWWRGRGRAEEAILALFGALTLLATWLILRTVILAAVVLPLVAVVAAGHWHGRRPWLVQGLAAAVLLVPPLFWFPQVLTLTAKQNNWYNPVHVRELRKALRAVEAHVPAGEPLCADEINSTAFLAHTAHPILVQPKWESSQARVRLQEFRQAATRGTPQELARFLRDHDTRYLALDWRTLWSARYQVGIPASVNGMIPGSALAHAVTTPDQLPGFELLWESDRFRLYRLLESADYQR